MPLRQHELLAAVRAVRGLALEDVLARMFHGELDHAERSQIGELLTSLHAVRTAAADDNHRALEAVRTLGAVLPADALRLIVARLDGDIRDLPGLLALGPYLAAPRTV